MRTYSYLIRFKLLDDNQFGFRKNSSSTLAISKIYEEVLNNIDQGLYTCFIFLDLSKAFDTTADHNVLLQKLEKNYGIKGSALELIGSYLHNRYQYTKVGNFKSTQQKVVCGVRQRSSLGPLLFILYINDLPSTSKISAILFADDTYLSLANKNLSNLEKTLTLSYKI